MPQRKKLWTSMSMATFVSASVLSGCSADKETEATQPPVFDAATVNVAVGDDSTAASHADDHAVQMGIEGESEGLSADIDLRTDDLAYLTQLGLMRGHLFVGKELYKAGHVEHAKTHMKHPESELYAAIEPALEFRGSGGFADQLQNLALSVENEQGDEAVEQAYTALMEAIAVSESKVSADNEAMGEKLKLAAALLQVAADEYAIAVVEGEMQNAHEYQDAFGFTHVANNLVANAQKLNAEEEMAAEKAAAIFSSLEPMWPSLIPPETLETEASQLYAAASSIELLAFGL